MKSKQIIGLFFVLIACLYVLVLSLFTRSIKIVPSDKSAGSVDIDITVISLQILLQNLFFEAESDPDLFWKHLERDPLGVHNISNFACPQTNARALLQFPIQLSLSSQKFKNGDPESFIFYQHLRKAGGTGFCDMASLNMPKSSVPSYYCMPDNRGSFATPPWSDSQYLLSHLREKGHRIISNEWDVFYSSFRNLSGVVLATTFRDPIDRWYSQYRFEHLERRDGSGPDAPRQSFFVWYNNNKNWMMGTNYYTKTFIGDSDPRPPLNKGDFYWTYHKYQHSTVSWPQFQQAVDNLSHFDLVLLVDWMSHSHTRDLLQRVLGWGQGPRQVLPHEVQALRAVKKSVTAVELMPAADYLQLVKENALDFLLLDVARRLFLEKAVCADVV